MFQKQGIFRQDKKWKRDKIFMDHDHQTVKKPIIFGCHDIEREKVASKPLEHFGEFGSYFYAPNRQTDPVYSITSHTAKDSKAPRTTIDTRPLLTQNLRWNPNIESSSVYQLQTNDKQNAEERSKITCRCKDCGSKHCRGQSISSDLPRTAFKDNIIRFTDNATMTPNLNDAGCGSSTPVYTSCKKTSDVSVPGSNIAVRDNYCAMALSQVYINSDPVSILKKTRYEPVKDYGYDEYDSRNTETEKKCKIVDDYQEAVRDIEENYNVCTKSKPLRPFPKVNRNILQDNCNDQIPPRKNIYNEGISDLLVNCLPPIPPPSYSERFPVTINVKKNYSNTCIKKIASRKDETPFPHNTESKYHYDCKTRAEFSYPSNSSERLMIKTKKFKKTFSSQPVPWSNTQAVKFPRKLLSSERDIESYISHQSQNSTLL